MNTQEPNSFSMAEQVQMMYEVLVSFLKPLDHINQFLPSNDVTAVTMKHKIKKILADIDSEVTN